MRYEIRSPALYRVWLERRMTVRGLIIAAATLGLAAGHEGGVRRLRQDDLCVRTFLAQDPANPRNSAAGTIARDPVVELLSGKISQDFPCRGGFVDVRVGVRFELPGQKPAIGFREFYGLIVHAETLFGPRRQHDFCPEKAHQLAPLDRK